MDVLTPEQRRLNMSRIRGKDTKPELAVRRLVHSMGFRFRLHRRDLPGCPDIVFPSRRKVINVHGCYWHVHACRFGRVRPATNAAFWDEKRQSNVVRDLGNEQRLRERGWSSLTIWECEVSAENLPELVRRFLGALS